MVFTFHLVKIIQKKFAQNNFFTTFAIPSEGNNIGEMAEWSNAAVLKTVDLNGSGGSNPSLSAEKGVTDICDAFFNFRIPKNIPKMGSPGKVCV